MKLKDFLNEFAYNEKGKVTVCAEGLDKIRAIIELDGLRACCSDRARLCGNFDMVWTLTWACKEWAVAHGPLELENTLWAYMAQKPKGRDARWKHVREVAKLVGITHYSHKRKPNA